MMEENISVSARVRPMGEKEEGQEYAWDADGKSIWQIDRPEIRFTVDNIFGPMDTTQHIYDTTLHLLVDKVVAGFNSTVFAYGQTSSGKTHTMQGTPEDLGVITLAVEDVFRAISNCPSREFLCRMSYMELYNEEVNDLLQPSNVKLPIHEDKDSKVYVAGLTEEIVHDAQSVLNYLSLGDENRHIAATKMNERSSRSHTIFKMIVESRSQDQSDECADAGAVLVSALTLVDLAGSERISKTGSEGLRMKEGTAINKSLLTLGIVINQLASNASAVSYRDSKLTRILQPSLGGNAKTAILCNITPANCHMEESSNTMRFACRAKKVVNSCTLNEVLSDEALMKRQAKEIEQLKRRLQDSGMIDVEDQICKMRNELLRSEHERELALIKLEEEKAEKEKAQRQVQVAAQLMFEKGGNVMGSFLKMAKRRDTWCPGPNLEEEIDAAGDLLGSKRGSGGEVSASPLSDMHSLRDECDLLMPPPPQRRKTSSRNSGEQRASGASNMEEDQFQMPEDPALLEHLLAKAVQEKKSLAEKMNELSRINQVKDKQISNLQKDLHAVTAVKHGEAGFPVPQRAPEESKHHSKRKRGQRFDSVSRELERRNKRLRKRCNETLEITENLEILALDALDQADASKQAASSLSSDLELTKAAVEEAKADVLFKSSMIEELQNQLNSAQEELRGIKGKLDDENLGMGAAEKMHKEELLVYQQQIGDLQKERDDLLSKLNLQEQRSKGRGEPQSAKMGDKSFSFSAKETDRLKKKVDDAEAKVRSLVREKADLQNAKNGLQRQLRGLEKTLERITKDVERKDAVFEKRKEALVGEASKAKDNIAELERKLKVSKTEGEEKDREIKMLEGEKINLEKQIEEGLKETNRIHQIHAATKSELDECEEENENLKRRAQEASASMDELYSTLVEAEAARDVNAQKVHALLSENKAISEQSQLWSDEISRLSCSLEKSLHERSEIVEYVKRELVIEKESLMSDLKAAGEAQAKAESDIQAKYMEVEYLRNELLELGTRAEEQKNLLEERNQSSDAIKKELQDELADEKRLVLELRQEMLRLEGSNKEMKENLEGATKHLSSLAEERAKEAWEWKKEMQELNKKHSEMMDSTLHERSALEQDLQKIQGTIKTKEDELCEIKERLKYQVQDLENQVKTLTVEKAEAGALKIKLAEAESVADQIRKELGEEIRKMCSDLTNKSEEIVQHEKEKEALRKLADDGIKQAESEHAQKMEQQKEDFLHELGKAGRTVDMQQQKIKEMEDAAQEHIKFKEMAKAKMLSKLKELQEQGRLASQLQSEFSALKVENENLSIQKSKAERETESWKALVKSEQSTEIWINTLVEKIYMLESRLKTFEEDFDSENRHLPTMQTVQSQLNGLQEDLLKAKRAEHELQGVQTALRTEIDRVGWDPKKLDALLEATRKEYKVKYYQGKTQRLQNKLKVAEEKIYELDAELRDIRKRIPPNRIEVDTSRFPPRSDGGTPNGVLSGVTNLQRSNWSAGQSRPDE